MTVESLAEVQGALLSYTDLEAESISPSEEQPVAQLWIRFTPDVVLRLFCANDVFDQSEEASSVFYFISRYENGVHPRFRSEVQRLLGVLNPLLPLGFLELHPEEGIVFRHVLLAEEKMLSGLLALDVIACLETLLPAIFNWLALVLDVDAPQSSERQQLLRQQFRRLLHQLPPISQSAVQRLATPISPVQLTGSKPFFLVLCAVLVMGFWGAWQLQQVLVHVFALLFLMLSAAGTYWLWSKKQGRQQSALRQLRFYWQLLELESFKLDYQAQAIQLQRERVTARLSELEIEVPDFPSDILRLRTHMRFLRDFQFHLLNRSQQIKWQREEIIVSREQLLAEQNVQKPPNLERLKHEMPPEDVLIQNLYTTLKYLDYGVLMRPHPQTETPTLWIELRASLPPIALSWWPSWQGSEQGPHTWMIGFDLYFTPVFETEHWPRVQEVVRLFSRFLPLGVVLIDYSQNQVLLRYRFVRLRGDVSTLLVMEILELMANFAEQISPRLSQCLEMTIPLDTILFEIETRFLAVQADT